MKLSKKQMIFTKHVGMFIAFAYENGIELTLGEAHRTSSQGLLYYFGYKISRGGVLGIKLVKSRRLSKTLRSLHLSRLAIDFNYFKNGKLTYKYEDVKILGDYWVSLDPKNTWGGDFNKNGIKDGFIDTPHIQRNL